jgi:hypothetical protein
MYERGLIMITEPSEVTDSPVEVLDPEGPLPGQKRDSSGLPGRGKETTFFLDSWDFFGSRK